MPVLQSLAEFNAFAKNYTIDTVHCTHPVLGGLWGCAAGYSGMAVLDFGHETHDLLSIGAAVSEVCPTHVCNEPLLRARLASPSATVR